MFDHKRFEEQLKATCGFLSVATQSRLDSYAADTIVELTDSQLRYFKSIPNYEITNKLIASQNFASFQLRGGNMCAEPMLRQEKAFLIFSGSVIAADAFYKHFFQRQ